MRIAAAALALAVLWVGAGAAAAEDRRMLDAAEASAFRGVGRLNVAGSRFCTATLISPREVLTAAHCLYHPRTGAAVPLGELRFVPAQRLDRNAGVWRVSRAAVAPGFELRATPEAAELGTDIALLELDAPVEPEAAASFGVGALMQDGPVPTIVSYAQDRAQAPSISPSCPPVGRIGDVLVIGCRVERGVSGAPVLIGSGDDARIVAVVSAMGEMPDGADFALTVLAEPWLATLRSELAAQPDD